MEKTILKKRIIAFLIDSLISTIIGFCFSGFKYSFILPFTIIGIYYILFDFSPLQGTIGNHVMGIKKVSESGTKVSFSQAIFRHFGRVISIATLNFVNGFSIKKDIFFHDKFSHTQVVMK